MALGPPLQTVDGEAPRLAEELVSFCNREGPVSGPLLRREIGQVLRFVPWKRGSASHRLGLFGFASRNTKNAEFQRLALGGLAEGAFPRG